MKVKDLIKKLEKLNPELDILNQSFDQDMGATILMVYTEVVPIQKKSHVILKWENYVYGETIESFIKKQNG